MSYLEDRIEIENQYCRYAHLLDTGRVQEIPAAIFTAEASVTDGTTASGREALAAWFSQAPNFLEGTSHNVTNIAIDIHGHTATSLARVWGWHWLVETKQLGPNRPVDYLQIAAYNDDWRREGGSWLIAHREVHNLGPGPLGLGIGQVPPWVADAPPLRETVFPISQDRRENEANREVKMSATEDRFAIQDVYYRYAYLIDTGNAARCPEEIFTEDAVVNYGTKDNLVGRKALIEIFAGSADFLDATSHNMTNLAVRIDGDRASCVGRVMGWHWFQSTKHLGPNRPVDFLQVAAYADEFRREQGRWKIAKRMVHALGPGNMGLGVGVVPPWPSTHPHLREARWPL